MKKIKKPNLNKLFYNNRFLLVFSVVLAVVVWLAVVIQFSPETERVIKDVPVNIELSAAMKDFGLKSFGEVNYTVDVTVSGKRYIVSPAALTADAIVVKANTNYVDSAGKYTLQLAASAVDSNAEFEITAVSTEMIDVYFDLEKEAEFTIESDVIAPDGIAPEGYYVGEIKLSNNTVKVTGPEAEVNRIVAVKAGITLSGVLTQTETFDSTVTALAENYTEPKYLTYDTDPTGVTLTIPVYKLENLTTGVSFINSPADYIKTPLKYTVSPASAYFAVAENKLEDMDGVISVATVDFADLKPGTNTFTVSSLSEEIGLVMDEEVKEFVVTVSVPNVEEKTVQVPAERIELVNAAQGVSPQLATKGNITVTVVGPASSLEAITADSIAMQVDVGELEAGGGASAVSFRPTVNEADDCWVIGSYNAVVTV